MEMIVVVVHAAIRRNSHDDEDDTKSDQAYTGILERISFA
jgi:hypothetical protein